MVEDCVMGLNALCSGDKVRVPSGGLHGVSQAQARVFEHIRNSVIAMGPCPQELNGVGAVSQLHAFDGYGDDQTPAAVTTYNPSLLSLPDAGNRAVPVAEFG